MKIVVKGEITSSKKKFRNVDNVNVELFLERVIKKLRKRLKHNNCESSSVGRA